MESGLKLGHVVQLIVIRSSRPEVFCKKGVLRNLTKLTGKHLCQSIFFNKVTPFYTERLWWLLCVILFHLTALSELMLYCFIFIVLLIKLDRICFADSSFFFTYIKIICQNPSKNPDCKIQITARKNFNLRYFISIFSLIDKCLEYRLPNIVVTWAKLLGPPFPTQNTQCCGNLSKVFGQLSQPLPSPSPFLWGC